MLELSKVGCKDLASSENKFKKKSFFKTPFWDPFQNPKPDPKSMWWKDMASHL